MVFHDTTLKELLVRRLRLTLLAVKGMGKMKRKVRLNTSRHSKTLVF